MSFHVGPYGSPNPEAAGDRQVVVVTLDFSFQHPALERHPWKATGTAGCLFEGLAAASATPGEKANSTLSRQGEPRPAKPSDGVSKFPTAQRSF